VDEAEAEWYRENARRKALTTWGAALIAIGGLIVAFGVVAAIAIGVQPALQNETFAVVTSAIAIGAMPFLIAGILFICAGFVAVAVLTGGPRVPPVVSTPAQPPRSRTF
jgi:hypothetical protein